MKKIAMGIIIGFVLSFSVSAYADDIKSLVGKSVQKEVNVSVNGKKIEGAGIIVNGSTYLPVRKIADSVGYNVNVAADKSVNLSEKEGESGNNMTNVDANIEQSNKRIKILLSEIENLEVSIQLTKMSINSTERDIEKFPDKKSFKDDLEYYNKLLDDQESKLEALKKEKAELESK